MPGTCSKAAAGEKTKASHGGREWGGHDTIESKVWRMLPKACDGFREWVLEARGGPWLQCRAWMDRWIDRLIDRWT